MRKYIIYIIGFSLLLVACQSSNDESGGKLMSNEKEAVELTEEELFDIYLLFKAPLTEEKKDLSEVVKVVFTENNSSTERTIALDLDRKVIHINPWISSSGILSEEEKTDVEGLEETITILEKYKVQDWKKDYSFEDPSSYEDGYGWSLWLQFSDGSVEKHKGSGSFKKELTPDGFEDFSQELSETVEQISKEND